MILPRRAQKGVPKWVPKWVQNRPIWGSQAGSGVPNRPILGHIWDPFLDPSKRGLTQQQAQNGQNRDLGGPNMGPKSTHLGVPGWLGVHSGGPVLTPFLTPFGRIGPFKCRFLPGPLKRGQKGGPKMGPNLTPFWYPPSELNGYKWPYLGHFGPKTGS